VNSTEWSYLSRSSARYSGERTEENHGRKRAEPRLVDRHEAGMFARPQRQIMGFPEQRVMRTQAVRTRLHADRERLMGSQDGNLFTIYRYENLADSDIVRRLPTHSDTRVSAYKACVDHAFPTRLSSRVRLCRWSL
jgi:hypothetical protein